METQTSTFPTKPLLTPDQVSAAKEEINGLEGKLQNPLIQDKGQVYKQLMHAQKLFAEQAPRPPESTDEEGRMVRRADQLLAEIVEGMPSQEEMRKAPPGAVDKHMRWEKRNKQKIMEWKHIRRRLTAGSSERDAANLEQHRPVSSTLNMDNAQITGKQFYMPATTSPVVTFSDEQLAFLKSAGIEPALLSNAQRAQVKDTMTGGGIGLEAAPKKNKGGRPKKVKPEQPKE